MSDPEAPTSKRAQRKAFNAMVATEARERLHRMSQINDRELKLNQLSSALINLAIDVGEFPTAMTVVRAMMGLDDRGNPVTAHIDRAARIDELWKLSGHFSGTNPEMDEYLQRRIERLEAQADG